MDDISDCDSSDDQTMVISDTEQTIVISDTDEVNDQDTRHTYAVYPPKVISLKILGYFNDANGIGYSRDIGRTSSFGGRIFCQFGDTFCKTASDVYVGLVNNTCSEVPDIKDPTRSVYPSIGADGMVAPFIPMTAAEIAWEERYKLSYHGRVTLWSFGGIVEDVAGCGQGWCWYEKGQMYQDGPTCLGSGVVRVVLDPTTGALCTIRPTEMIFGPNEPRWGTFSSLVQNGYAYLWGSLNEEIFLARVPIESAPIAEKYEAWNGTEYVSDRSQATPVLANMAQGAIWKSNLFKPDAGLDYVFIGVSGEATNQVLLAAAGRLEGPFEKLHVVCVAQRLLGPDGYRYCVYPHPWAFREEDGELLISWCEHWPGGVVAAKVSFEMVDMEELVLSEASASWRVSKVRQVYG